MKISMNNLKLKNLLKKLFENREFEMTLTDVEYVYDGYNNVTQDLIYEFKFHVVVRSVIGEGTDAVGDMDIIIDSITKNGKDHYHIWVENNYSNRLWYINELDETFHLDYLEELPFSVYTTVYGHDESVIKESMIKKIIRESVMEKFIDSTYPELNNLKVDVERKNKIYKKNVRYWDPDELLIIFRVVEPFSSLYWDSDDPSSRISTKEYPKTVWVLSKVMDGIRGFFPNDDMFIKWFNQKYNQNVENVGTKWSLN